MAKSIVTPQNLRDFALMLRNNIDEFSFAKSRMDEKLNSYDWQDAVAIKFKSEYELTKEPIDELNAAMEEFIKYLENKATILEGEYLGGETSETHYSTMAYAAAGSVAAVGVSATAGTPTPEVSGIIGGKSKSGINQTQYRDTQQYKNLNDNEKVDAFADKILNDYYTDNDLISHSDDITHMIDENFYNEYGVSKAEILMMQSPEGEQYRAIYNDYCNIVNSAITKKGESINGIMMKEISYNEARIRELKLDVAENKLKYNIFSYPNSRYQRLGENEFYKSMQDLGYSNEEIGQKLDRIKIDVDADRGSLLQDDDFGLTELGEKEAKYAQIGHSVFREPIGEVYKLKTQYAADELSKLEAMIVTRSARINRFNSGYYQASPIGTMPESESLDLLKDSVKKQFSDGIKIVH